MRSSQIKGRLLNHIKKNDQGQYDLENFTQ